MPIVTPLETDPVKISDIQAYSQGEDIELSEECTKWVDLLTGPESETPSVSVRMGRVETLPFNNDPIESAPELLFPAGYTQTVVSDFENPDGIFEVRPDEDVA